MAKGLCGRGGNGPPPLPSPITHTHMLSQFVLCHTLSLCLVYCHQTPQGGEPLQAFHFPLTLDTDCAHMCLCMSA